MACDWPVYNLMVPIYVTVMEPVIYNRYLFTLKKGRKYKHTFTFFHTDKGNNDFDDLVYSWDP